MASKKISASGKASSGAARGKRSSRRGGRQEAPLDFPVVGIGASAGGLEAFTELLRPLATDTGMAFVFVQHLAPTHESLLTEILARATDLPVRQVKDRMPVAPDHVYVIPPGTNMVIAEGRLELSPLTEARGQRRAIDHFLRSLAEHQGHRAIGVVLSGTGTDGTLGLEEIKAAGGLTFAQDESAQQASMPGHAIAAGCADLVLPPREIAREIARIARHPYVAPAAEAGPQPDPREAELLPVIEILRHATNVDFTHYKRNTLYRRVDRRIVLHKLAGFKQYVRLLQSNPAEVEALYHDVLINVTSFFRDPDAFEALKSKVFPELTQGRSRHDPVRVWVLGCSTGEEAYSIAIAFTEYCESVGKNVPLQIFATDLNGAGIEKARAGLYSKNIAQDVSPERLRRFFMEIDGSYRISKQIRDKTIFAQHDVLAAPPFSHIDLVSCRNLLIYLDAVAQQKLLPVLHYALRPKGDLWLGASETIGSQRELFDLLDPKQKIYVKKPGPARLANSFPLAGYTHTPPVLEKPIRLREAGLAGSFDAQKEADRILLTRYAPPAVLVNGDLEILQFRGDTGAYLTPAPGKASLNLLKMLREGLLVAVRGAIHKARKEEVLVREENLRVRSNGGYRTVNVEVVPLARSLGSEGLLLVLFEEGGTTAEMRSRITRAELAAAEGAGAPRQESVDEEVVRLSQELSATREYLQSVIEQQEAANEELQSANEEVQSANEELQSINEELETSKEEIQSSNEELATVNDELQNRNLELSRSNNDFTNLLTSVQMAILILGPDLRIRRFTPMAERLLNLIAADVGRPIGDIRLNVDVENVEGMALEVIETVTPREVEAKDRQGRWYSLRIRPYRTIENQIDGAVLILVDVDSLKRGEESLRASEQALRESEERFAVLANSSAVLIWVNGLEGCEFVNRAYLDFLGVEEREVQGYDWARFLHPEDREPYLDAYRDAFGRRAVFEAQFRFLRADGEYRWMKSAALPRFDDDGEFLGLVGATFDVTDLKLAEASLRDSDRTKNEFLAMLAHELRNPLAPMRNVIEVLKAPQTEDGTLEWAREVIERQVHNMARMIDDLLDISRVTRDQVHLRKEPVELTVLLERTADLIRSASTEREQSLTLTLPPKPIYVNADPLRLEQVFGNLLSNASKFTPREGHIQLEARPLDGGSAIEVAVRDDGEGIASEVLPRVFDLFVQGERTLERAHGGLGIGLTLVKSLVQLHGGSVEASSDGPGKGSEFTVRLPTMSAKEARQAARQARPRQDGTPAQRRILVVDDNEDAAVSMAMLLRLSGHQVEVARSGQAALAAALELEPEIVLLDIGLPGMDGYEVARRLRRDPQLNGALLVAVSGYGKDENRRQATEAGFDHYFTKPLDPTVLDELLRGGPAH